MRSPIQKVTVPAAGKDKVLKMSGASIYLITGAPFSKVESAALIHFDDLGNFYPAVTNSKWAAEECFEEVNIRGTSESAGTVLRFMILPVCVDPVLGKERLATVGDTKSITMDDTVKSLTLSDVTSSDGDLPKEILVSARGTGNINFKWNTGSGSDPATGETDSHLLVPDRQPITIQGIRFIKDNLKFINAVLGETPKFIYTRRF